MNPTLQDAQSRRPDSASGDDPQFRAAAPPERADLADPTEDLANDATSELPGTGTRPQTVPPRLFEGDTLVANDETTDVATAIATGVVLRDRYVLGMPLGYGGTSVVYRARDLRRGEVADESADVAIKLLRAEFRDRPRCIARLRREFQQTQSVAHPNVVRFHDLDCDRGNWFIAMELLVGESMGQRLRHAAPAGLAASEALRIAAACGEALAHAHAHGVTHGDVKPDNIFVTAEGEIRMLDFGVAAESLRSPLAGDRTIPDPLRGAMTRAYASPEVLSGQSPESRDDVFSLACLTYEMLAGRHPYGRRGADEARDAGFAVERLRGISEHRWRALASGLAWRREDRPAIRELLRDLEDDAPELKPVQVTALPVQVVQGEFLRRPDRRWLGSAGIGLAIALGVLIGRYAFDSQGGLRSEGTALRASTGSNDVLSPAADLAPATDAALLARLAPPVPLVAQAPALPLPAEAQNPSAPGLVAFDSGTMLVSSRAIVAPVPLRHSGTARRSVTVAWRVLDGTAIAGRDYGGPQSGVARFAEGHTYRMIYVPIVGNSRATGDRSFTVELTDASPGASLGVTSRIVVTIQDDA